MFTVRLNLIYLDIDKVNLKNANIIIKNNHYNRYSYKST